MVSRGTHFVAVNLLTQFADGQPPWTAGSLADYPMMAHGACA